MWRAAIARRCLCSSLPALSWAIGQRDQPGSLFNRQPSAEEAVHNLRPTRVETNTAPIANFSLLDRYLNRYLIATFWSRAPDPRPKRETPGRLVAALPRA
jgi:hypothetical protein